MTIAKTAVLRFTAMVHLEANSGIQCLCPIPLNSPGESVNIRTNGFSIGDPLYIIDGIEANKVRMAKISPNNIENVTVLKGASAGAYGERGKNGVILITTKKK